MASSDQARIGILGTGRIAQALGRLFAAAGEPVVAVAGRRIEQAQVAAKFIGGATEAVSSNDLPTRADRSPARPEWSRGGGIRDNADRYQIPWLNSKRSAPRTSRK